MSFKKKIENFSQWQRDPGYFSPNREKMNHCQCCGEDFAGNFCPTCGQRASLGPINWESVRTGIMDVWGMGSRSLPRTLWHLLLRPGYLIGDYISGKRQVSFPPVKMLVIVALVMFLIVSWIDPTTFQEEAIKPLSNDMSPIDKFDYTMQHFMNSIQTHIDWLFLLILSFLIIPTWVVFRYAPQHSHHTLPQGFFIQVLNSSAVILFAFLLVVLNLIKIDSEIFSIIFIVLTLVHLLRTYKQLFGYSWWSTTWRLVAVVAAGVNLIIIGVILFALVVFVVYGEWNTLAKGSLNMLFYVLPITIILVTCHLINKRQAKAARD